MFSWMTSIVGRRATAKVLVRRGYGAGERRLIEADVGALGVVEERRVPQDWRLRPDIAHEKRSALAVAVDHKVAHVILSHQMEQRVCIGGAVCGKAGGQGRQGLHFGQIGRFVLSRKRRWHEIMKVLASYYHPLAARSAIWFGVRDGDPACRAQFSAVRQMRLVTNSIQDLGCRRSARPLSLSAKYGDRNHSGGSRSLILRLWPLFSALCVVVLLLSEGGCGLEERKNFSKCLSGNISR